MPRGPKGEKRPADVIGMSVKVMRIATGEEEEELPDSTKSAATELGSRGGKARAAMRAPRKSVERHWSAEVSPLYPAPGNPLFRIFL